MKLSAWALEHLRLALIVVLLVGVPTLFGFHGNVILLLLEGLISMAMGPFQWVGLTRRFDGEKSGFNRSNSKFGDSKSHLGAKRSRLPARAYRLKVLGRQFQLPHFWNCCFNRFGLDWLAITFSSGVGICYIFFFGLALSAPGPWDDYTEMMMSLTGVPVLLVGFLTSGSQVSVLRKCWPTATEGLGWRWFWASYLGWTASWTAFGAAVGLVVTSGAGPIFNEVRLLLGMILLPLSWAFYGLVTGWALAGVDGDTSKNSTQPVKLELPSSPAPRRKARP